MERSAVQSNIWHLLPLWNRNEPLPKELEVTAQQFLRLSKSLKLKPTEEPARAYLCALIACESLAVKLELPKIYRERAPLPAGELKKLHKLFSELLLSQSDNRSGRSHIAARSGRGRRGSVRGSVRGLVRGSLRAFPREPDASSVNSTNHVGCRRKAVITTRHTVNTGEDTEIQKRPKQRRVLASNCKHVRTPSKERAHDVPILNRRKRQQIEPRGALLWNGTISGIGAMNQFRFNDEIQLARLNIWRVQHLMTIDKYLSKTET